MLKKILALFFFFLAISIFAQNDDLKLKMSSFSPGDTINGFGVSGGLAFKLEGADASKYNFKKWSIAIVNKNGTVITSAPVSSPSRTLSNQIFIPDEIYKSWHKIAQIEISGILLSSSTEKNAADVPFDPQDGKAFVFYVIKKEVKKVEKKPEEKKPVAEATKTLENAVPPKLIDYSGKLLTGKEKNKPLANQKVNFKDQVTKEQQTAVTDNYGDFTFKNINANDSAQMSVDLTINIDGELYMARKDGSIIRSFNRANNIFYFDFIPPELITFQKVPEEDTQLKLSNFNTSKQSEITVVEDIHYPPNSADVLAASLPKLDKLVEVMIANKALKLNITSHTDSKGDDAYNMTLSQKRAQKVLDYFVSKGIDKSRLVAKGMGESMILNRCKNGIDCSETEHELNRRTEFKFTK